jgi:hypothetical protein
MYDIQLKVNMAINLKGEKLSFNYIFLYGIEIYVNKNKEATSMD